MKIFVNGEGQTLDVTTVADLVQHVTGESDPAGVAVAHNGQVVRRAEWSTTELVDDDRIEVLRATAGG